jgi:hypothetical protein
LVLYMATTALPYPYLERATAGLRAELRHLLLEARHPEAPDWARLTVQGPQEFADGTGRTWFGYWAALETPGAVTPTRGPDLGTSG